MWVKGDTCRPDTAQITSLRSVPQREQLRPSHKEGEHDEGLASKASLVLTEKTRTKFNPKPRPVLINSLPTPAELR